MPELGRAALLVTLGLSIYALVAGAYAAHLGRRGSRARRRTRSSRRSSRRPSRPAVLLAALLRNDFSFKYVARTTSEALPTPYTISAFWGGQEGSLLLWLLDPHRVRRSGGEPEPRVGARPDRLGRARSSPPCATFFAFLAGRCGEPVRHAGGAGGRRGMTPSLQNPYMLAHPPLLYLGYVGLTVPFAFAIGALLSGKLDERWLIATRRWTLFAWAALGIGQLLGSHWAYVEVGWGGYYAWDPVENAALMPWLAATAFLHSVMIQEKRGMLKVWNVLLVILAFSLALFGTFLTRSGVVNSIHSFTQSSIGPWFLAFIAVTVAASLATRVLAAAAAPLADEARVGRSRAKPRSSTTTCSCSRSASRSSGASSIRCSPRRSAARRSCSGARTTTSSCARSGFPCSSSWGSGRSSRGGARRSRALRRRFAGRRSSPSVTGVVLLVLGAGSSIPGLVAYTFSAFVLTTIVMEFARGTRARKALGAPSWLGAFTSLIARNRRRYGGYVVHAAIVLFAIGVAGLERLRLGRRGEARARASRCGSATTRSSTGRSTSARARMRPRSGRRSTSRAGDRDLGSLAGRQERVHDRAAGLERGRHPQ